MTDSSHDKSRKRARHWRWMLFAFATAGVVLAYSVGLGLSQLAMVATGLQELSARAAVSAVAPGAARQPPSVASPVSEPATASVDTSVPAASQPVVASAAPAPDAIHPPRDDASFKAELETLLAADPDALEAVRELLSERDPAVLAENMRLLRDTFAVD